MAGKEPAGIACGSLLRILCFRQNGWKGNGFKNHVQWAKYGKGAVKKNMWKKSPNGGLFFYGSDKNGMEKIRAGNRIHSWIYIIKVDTYINYLLQLVIHIKGGFLWLLNIIPLGSHQFPASEPPGNFFLESHLRHKI